MMKLLVTVPWGDRAGGAENMLWTFLRHVDRSRNEPKVVFFEHGPFEREVAGLGMRTAVVPSGRLRELARATGVVRFGPFDAPRSRITSSTRPRRPSSTARPPQRPPAWAAGR
jgi:hypothetical protein